MKKILFYTCACIATINVFAQETISPATAQKEIIALTNATIHVGNGHIINNGTVVFNNGKITEVGTTASVNGARVIDCKGKHIYPGLILSSSQLGLIEINNIRATIDATEIGEMNPSIRSLVAYNTDSKVINTLRTNGILLANIVPSGGIISGSSSVVQLDAWNWEDAAYKTDGAIHFHMPSLLNRGRRRFFSAQSSNTDPVKEGLSRIEEVKTFFREAKAYLAQPKHENTNLKFEAVKGLFDKKQKLFIHCNIVKEMLLAVDFAKEFGFDVVLVGAVDSWQIADILKKNNIAVILNQLHDLPAMIDDDIDQPFKTPAMLQKAGVLFCINDDDGNSRYRNLAFNAGTASAYGLSKEEALSAITLNAATILGIADKTGSIETGKDANIVVSEGDILDMRTNIIDHAFIQGRQIVLNNKQMQLADKYEKKYGIK
ncbi:MAG: amidohydrolase family protein [Ferruginibacter sp.]|nr:amidohydrolase family protein [Bacteroidota bacterium]MBX2920277.1 amidohydrolase family protein [Ferruginibacter sp.]MCB0708942.1 amidohydrolase family protein [Chitinophagaceae bacterium]MCC7377863.1 amidohydrolase family protein [Chitinophagaceae bacterium]